MKIKAESRYLTFPVVHNVEYRKLHIEIDGTPVCLLDVPLDCDVFTKGKEPEMVASVDIGRFAGKTLDVFFVPEADFEVGTSERVITAWDRHPECRPLAHFTVDQGWNNDPNGLVYVDGTYHLFCQHNPIISGWGNMHWAHATSADLIHWENKGDVLFPNRFGAVFSGSAFYDRNNVSGLGSAENPPLLLYYTGAGEFSDLCPNDNFTQCLAYSTDGGETFRDYENNPLLTQFVPGNRDPKAVYVPELDVYILVLFLDGNTYRFFKTENLKDFEVFCDVVLPGAAECPDIFRIKVDGEDVYKWAFLGANDNYYVGHFDENGFVPEGECKSFLHGASDSYAAQTFSNTEDRIVRIAWSNLTMEIPDVEGQMTVPREVRLHRDTDGELRLTALPVKELTALYGDVHTLPADEVLKPASRAVMIEIKGEWDEGKKIVLTAYGLDITVDMAENLILYGEDGRMPVSVDRDSLDILIEFDIASVDFFTDHGRHLMVKGIFGGRNGDEISYKTDSEKTLSVKITELVNK